MNNENIPEERELSDLRIQNTKAIYNESGEQCITVINEVNHTKEIDRIVRDIDNI